MIVTPIYIKIRSRYKRELFVPYSRVGVYCPLNKCITSAFRIISTFQSKQKLFKGKRTLSMISKLTLQGDCARNARYYCHYAYTFSTINLRLLKHILSDKYSSLVKPQCGRTVRAEVSADKI